MKKRILAACICLSFILTCIACTTVSEQNPGKDSEQINNEDYVLYDNLADFLSAEQIDLYIRAQKIYPLFKGHPDGIDTLHLSLNNASYNEIKAFKVGLSSRREYDNYVISGYQYNHTINDKTYLLCMGEYQSLNSLEDVCLSVFTNEYWDQLNCIKGEYKGIPQFIEIDGRLYYNLVSMGNAFGYNPSEFPDKYELTSISDVEICFNVIGHYKSSNTDPNYSVTTQSFPVKLVLTDEGWRFSLFNTASS